MLWSRILLLVQRIMTREREADPVPIYLLDDDRKFRSSIVALLQAHGHDVEEFASVNEFTTELRQRAPGVLLLDLRMPKVGGLDFLEGNEELRSFGTIVISGHGDIEAAVRAVHAGAVGFIEKPFAADELLAKVGIAIAKVRSWIARDSESSELRSRMRSLSPRECQILQAMVDGGSNKSIARELNISVRTVEMHRSHMMTKMGVRSSAEAVHMATLANLSQTK